MLGDKTAQGSLPEAIGPALNIRSAAPQSPRDLAHALPARTPQDDIGTAGILGTHAAGAFQRPRKCYLARPRVEFLDEL
jgi:hypothetical protein